MLKKSEVLKEGYIKGLRKALAVIKESIEEGKANTAESKEHLIWGNDWQTANDKEKELRREIESAGDNLEEYTSVLVCDEYGNPVLDDDGVPQINEEKLKDSVWDRLNEEPDAWLKGHLSQLDDKYAKIVLEVSLGLWNGRHNGMAMLDNFTDIFTEVNAPDGMRLTYKDGEVYGKIVHHDGTNTFTVWGITDEKLSEFYDRQEADPDFYDEFPNIEDLAHDYCVNGNSSEEFEKCFEPVGPELAKIYGWK